MQSKLYKKLNFQPVANEIFDTSVKNHWQDPPIERIDNCRNKIFEEDTQKTMSLRRSRQNILKGIFEKKMENRDEVNQKLMTKSRRKSIETQIVDMKKTLTLMER